ncbi:iron complex outermembrane recepter protein [Salinimicrobium catena]|uniref:Iron complex outermembrane recepter protein n=1 Tax=Salinimicrobium catena TaxID=390640 RepID=A0A1H5NNE4_9FLAO|nr:TonB-dependent receptor [Salinimicrobium catena]SDL56566.1 iron complex outermembrane recepter protein [Salinimicrobium catena]SEF02974.1 iron complex outermembrane recepter protein [Salinimicrobium catena]
MKHFALYLSLLLFCGNLAAQNISGNVINASTGEAVDGALINVAGSSEKTTTDDRGKFELELKEFPVVMTISASGFETLLVTISNSEEDLIFQLFPLAESLSEVVLRSTLIPRELMRTPASVSILGQEEIQRTDKTNILSAVDRAPGVNVLQGALNTNKISIRGVGARAQYSSNRIKAYFMGIPLSTAEGETTLDDIDPAVIERVEIIKGPVSSIYGAGLGGVITMYPDLSAKEGSTAAVSSTFGSFGLMKHTVNASHSSESTKFSATYNHLSADGYRENGEYDRDSFTLFGQVAGNKKNALSLLGHLVRLKAYIPSSLNREDFENDPSSAAYTWAASQGYESYDKGLLGLSYEQEFSEKFFHTSSIFMNFRNGYEPRPFDILKEEQVATGFRTKFGLKNELFSLPSEMSFGGEIYREWYDTATFENLYEEDPGKGSVAGSNLSNNEQDRSYYNLFAQWNVSVSEKLELEAGLNLNSTRYELTDLYTEDEVDQTGNYRFKSIFSPRLGAVYTFLPGKNLYASVSHGFSTPTVAETLTPEGIINTALKPETGVNYEIGFKGNFLDNRLYAEVSAFSIQVDNLLVAERVAEDRYIGRNLGKTDHNGLEFLAKYNFNISSWLSAKTFLNASFNDFYFGDFVDAGTDLSGNDLPAVPDKSLNAGFDLHTSNRFSLFTSFQHEGQMPLNDQNTGYTEAYELLNLKLSYAPDIFKNWETAVFFGINNVFDEHYAASIVPNAVGFGGAEPRYFYPGDPRNYFGGISVSYFF